MVDIRVYPDDNGQPGEPALCSYDGIATTLHGFEQPVLRVPLPTAMLAGTGSLLGVGRAERRFRHGLGRWITQSVPPSVRLGVARPLAQSR